VKKMSETNEATTNVGGSSLVQSPTQERLYGQQGFTDQIIPILQPYKNLNFSNATYYYYDRVPSEVLLQIVPLLPKKNYEEERQNYSPTIKDFVEIAKKEPRAKFDLYIITKERDDERLTIETIYLPKERNDLVISVLEKALDYPDAKGFFEEYFYMWWD
jgi:hypothetical protein